MTDICCMEILLISATGFEIAPAMSILAASNGHYQGNRVKVLQGGIGLLSTAYQLTRQIHQSRPDFVLQAGIAGSFDSNRPLAEAVLVKEETVADLGVVENNRFQSVFDLKLIDAQAFPFNNGKLVNPDMSRWDFLHLKSVTAISVNEITTDAERIKEWKKKYQAETESMEGAALHYICLQEKIPFLQLRTISNVIGERDKSKWQMKEAIRVLNEYVMEILGRI